MTIAEGRGEGERRLIDLLALPQVKTFLEINGAVVKEITEQLSRLFCISSDLQPLLSKPYRGTFLVREFTSLVYGAKLVNISRKTFFIHF